MGESIDIDDFFKKTVPLLEKQQLQGLVHQSHHLIENHFKEVVEYISSLCILYEGGPDFDYHPSYLAENFLYQLDIGLARKRYLMTKKDDSASSEEDVDNSWKPAELKLPMDLQSMSQRVDRIWHTLYAELLSMEKDLNGTGTNLLIGHHDRESKKSEYTTKIVNSHLSKAWHLAYENDETADTNWVWDNGISSEWIDTAYKRGATSHFSVILEKMGYRAPDRSENSPRWSWDVDGEIVGMRIRQTWDRIVQFHSHENWRLDLFNEAIDDELMMRRDNDFQYRNLLIGQYGFMRGNPLLLAKGEPQLQLNLHSVNEKWNPVYWTASLINLALLLAGDSGKENGLGSERENSDERVAKGRQEIRSKLRDCLFIDMQAWKKRNSSTAYPLNWLYDMVWQNPSTAKNGFWKIFGFGHIEKIQQSCPMYPLLNWDSFGGWAWGHPPPKLSNDNQNTSQKNHNNIDVDTLNETDLFWWCAQMGIKAGDVNDARKALKRRFSFYDTGTIDVFTKDVPINHPYRCSKFPNYKREAIRHAADIPIDENSIYDVFGKPCPETGCDGIIEPNTR